MKKVYVIYSSSDYGLGYNLGIVSFVFSSLKKANAQMDTIVKLINEGKWYVDKEYTHIVRSDENKNLQNTLRDVVAYCNETKVHSLYRLCECELNASYGI